MKITDIVIGARHRKDMGDIAGLAGNLKELGLLHPVVVDSGGKLICGGRRLEAAKHLGWVDIEVTIARNLDDVELAERAELAENEFRKDLLPSEAVARAAEREHLEMKAAEERQAAGRRIGTQIPRMENFPEREKGRAADKVAASVQMSRPTLDKAKAIVAAAKADPIHFGDLPAKMDATKKVDPVFKEAQSRAESHPVPSVPRLKPTPRPAASRWATHIANLIQIFKSIEDAGGMSGLIESWADDEREDYLETLTGLRDQLDAWIKPMEKSCRSKLSV